MTDDSHDHIPPIIPARDEVVARSQNPSRKRQQPASKGGAATGLWARLFIVLSLVVAAVATGWAWQLQQQLQVAETSLANYGERIADLEDRLSDTDEGVNQSGAAMAVKIKELYSEVDKLWASAWRKNKAKIADLEKASGKHSSELATLGKTDKAYSSQLKALAVDMQKFKAVAGDLERLVQSAQANETQLEKLGDDVNRMGLEYAKLQKRVTTNEEWVDSINGFRKQVNRSLSELNARLSELQGGAPSTP
jgi:chromosome segregation ATPase